MLIIRLSALKYLGRCNLCHLNVFERRVELIAEHRQVVVEFLACDFGVNLGGHDIGVSQASTKIHTNHRILAV